MYILSTQNYVYSIKKIRVNQLVISKSIYFKTTLTGFSTLRQVDVAVSTSLISNLRNKWMTILRAQNLHLLSLGKDLF